VLALSTAALVRADGDPASDTLLAEDAYLPFPSPGADVSARLKSAVAAAYTRGYLLKVAVIATVNDLGAIPSLFGKPNEYASFLGQEIKFYYGGPLLIVMPAGFGIYDQGLATTAEEKVLAGRTVKSDSADTLTASAADAVQALVAAGALKSKDTTPPYVGMLPAGGNAARQSCSTSTSSTTARTQPRRSGSWTPATRSRPCASGSRRSRSTGHARQSGSCLVR
jgi:hypothetical protein